MTLRHMRIFIAVCKENGITKAAEALHIAQPAVSVAVKELEDYYSVKLFDRLSRRLYLTDMGRLFLERAIHIISLFDDMEKDLHLWEGTSRLRIGASITIGTDLMPRYISTFRNEHPQAHIEVTIGNSALIEKKILENGLDLALIEGVVHSQNIMSETYRKDRLAVICSPLNPLCQKDSISMNEFLDQPLLLRETGSGTRELFDNTLASFERTYTPSWESTSNEALIHAATAGLGVAVMSYMIARPHLDRGAVAELNVSNLHFERGFHIIYHKNKFLTGLAKAFMDLCRNFTM